MAKTNAKQAGAPTLAPPEAATGDGVEVGATRPSELMAEELLAGAEATAVAGGAPALAPPAAALAEEGVTAWLSDKRVSGLWSIDEVRNSWVAITGVGWKKLHNTSDSALTALTMLGAHARQMSCRVDYREEADGMIHEMYVW